jgi:isocitrate dehydrogenase (NAD+)
VKEGRKKITCVHKANIMKLSDGEFLSAARETSLRYPSIKFEEMIVDATCMNLTLKPQTFDVMLLPNLYGSIMGSVVAGIVGGPGIAVGVNVGANHMMFEQGARHPAKDLVASNSGNPVAFILSSALMLKSIGLATYSKAIENAVHQVISEGKVRTPDIGGRNTMSEVTNEILSKVRYA